VGGEQQPEETGLTRRRVVSVGAAVAAAQALPALRSGTIATARAEAPPCAPRPPGLRRMALALSPGGRTLWTADSGGTTISAYRARDLAPLRSLDVGEAPLDIAISPSGRRALVTNGFYDRPGLAVVDLVAGRLVERMKVGPGAYAVAFGPDGTGYVAGGGGAGRLLRLDTRRGEVAAEVALGRDPRGLEVTPDGRHALIALNGDAAVAVVALDAFTVVARIPTAPFPYLVAAAPRGLRAYVSHNGFAARRVSVVDLGRRRSSGRLAVGPDPAGIAFAGPRAVAVAERGGGTVSVFDPRTGRRRRRIITGGWPRAIVARGRRAYVADEQTGQLRTFGI
jgi:DNA-binding beta-propeller fold protein YncE